jgi:hypothetical protein
MSSTKYIDYLTEDDPIPRQNWVCISFLSPEGIKNCNIRGLKIRGVYDTRQEADARAKYLQNIDPDFHVFVGQVGLWLPWDPDPNDAEDQEYQEKELNDLMKGYKENLVKTRKMEEQRKRDMIEKNMQDQNKSGLEQTQDRLRRKLENKKNRLTNESSSSSTSSSSNTSSGEIEDKLQKIQEIYNTIKK